MGTISIPAAAAIVGGAGAATSAAGSISSSITQGRAAAYQAQVAANNAATARSNATYSAEAGTTQAQVASMRSRAQLGTIKAAQGANDIDVNTGSAATVQSSQRETGQFDSLTALNRALLQANSYQAAATGYTAQSQLEQSEAAEAPIAGALEGTGGLLGSASSIGFKSIFSQNNPNVQGGVD